ncbi:hypothetical protein O6H91_23G049700 [Diphasiastrum complanatum]|nr:hypothetical protein O6H91_23G049700 [Diphasiastrum complanatum]
MIGSKEKWSSTSAKVSKSTYDPFSTTSTQQGLSASRQRVLDALRQSEKGGKLTKFGQPVVPSNLFDEPKSSEAGSEPFQFSFNRGQLFLVFSFLLISSLMFGTAFLVWKVGAIHYNEY